VGGLVAWPYQTSLPSLKVTGSTPIEPIKIFPSDQWRSTMWHHTIRSNICHISEHDSTTCMPSQHAIVPTMSVRYHVLYDCMDHAPSVCVMCHPCSGAMCHNMTRPPINTCPRQQLSTSAFQIIAMSLYGPYSILPRQHCTNCTDCTVIKILPVWKYKQTVITSHIVFV
jgi:hypothetical protein